MLFFTDRGRVYREKIYDLPEAERNARGNHLKNTLPLEEDEQVYTVLSVNDFDVDGSFVFATRNGTVKKTPIREYANIYQSGLIAINLNDDDELVSVKMADGDSEIIMATHNGQSIRFHESDARDMGRATQGVRGIKLKKGDAVVSLVVVNKDEKEDVQLLSVSEQGYGKRTKLEEYSLQGRGGQGVINLKVTDKTGAVISVSKVKGDEELFVLSEGGVLIRTRVSEVSTYGRSSQGVTIMRLDNDDKGVAAFVMMAEDDVDEISKEAVSQAKKDAKKEDKKHTEHLQQQESK